MQVEYFVAFSDPDQENPGPEKVWIKEDEIRNRRLIANYDAALIKDRVIKNIIGAAPAKTKRGESIWYFCQWVDAEIVGAWLHSEVMKKRFPQELIKFFEDHLKIGGVNEVNEE